MQCGLTESSRIFCVERDTGAKPVDSPSIYNPEPKFPPVPYCDDIRAIIRARNQSSFDIYFTRGTCELANDLVVGNHGFGSRIPDRHKIHELGTASRSVEFSLKYVGVFYVLTLNRARSNRSNLPKAATLAV